MKLQDAIELGKECGLVSPHEAVNNVILHSMSLFEYKDIQREEAELLTEAASAGVLFCSECGLAMGEQGCLSCSGKT
jgi:hypothetical protein